MDVSTVRGRILIILGTIVFSIFGLLLDSVGVVGVLYDLSSVVSLPIRHELRKVSINTNNFLGAVSKISSLQGENAELTDKNNALTEELSELLEIQKEYEVLQEQVNVLEKVSEPAVKARIVSSDIAIGNTIQINVGSKEGIEVSDIVIFGTYAVGKITDVETYSSKVMLITSPSINLPVRGQKNRAKGLVNGDVGLTLKMEDILLDEKIVEGETIITSGIQSEFPSGLLVGVVQGVADNPTSATQEAEVQVQVDFSKLEIVYVIKGQK